MKTVLRESDMNHDALLIQQSIAGDSQSFEHLVRKYHRTVYLLATRWLRNPEDAQETTQDVFLKAYRNLISLRQPESFDAWLRGITRHECLNRLRKRQLEAHPLPPDLASNTLPVDERIIQSETLDKIIQVIDSLPKLERELLKSYYLEDIPYIDLQETYSLSYKAITMRVLRAKREVKEQIEKTFSDFHLTPDKKLMASVMMEAKEQSIINQITKKGAQAMIYTPFHFRAPHAAKKDGKFGYIDKTGKMIITPQFDRAMSFCEGLGRVGIGEKQGYVDETGKIVIPLQFDEAYPFHDGLAAARTGEKFGYIDKRGEFVIQPKFDHVEPFFEGIAAVDVGEKWGYIDKKGKYIVEPQYDKVWPFNDGIAPVVREGTYGYIEKTGKLIYSF